LITLSILVLSLEIFLGLSKKKTFGYFFFNLSIFLLSVDNTTLSKNLILDESNNVHSTKSFPLILRKFLFGNLFELLLAGIKHTNFIFFINYFDKFSVELLKLFFGAQK
jgi:hypothetical protein